MRVAVSHVFFNIAGVLTWFAFIGELSELVNWISSGDKARQIANAHTIFNVANSIVFIWLVNPVSKLVMYLVPERKKDAKKLFPELHSYYLENCSMALDLCDQAIQKMGEYSLSIIENGIDVALFGNSVQLAQMRKKDDIIDHGHT